MTNTTDDPGTWGEHEWMKGRKRRYGERTPEFETLERIKFASAQTMPREVIENIPVDTMLVRGTNLMIDEFVLRAKMQVFGKRLPDENFEVTKDFGFPKTTWQMWKERSRLWSTDHRLGRWLVRKFPVRYEYKRLKATVDISRALVFPEVNIPTTGYPIVQIAKHVDLLDFEDDS